MNKSEESPYKHRLALEEKLGTVMPMNKARLSCLSMLVLCLIETKTVNLVNLSLNFQGLAQAESSYRRIKRFFSEVRLDETIIAKLILNLLPAPPYTVCVDRTNWRFGKANINILVIAIAHKGIAFPIVWSFLDKRGNSSTEERIELLKRFLDFVKPHEIQFFLADREFIGDAWFNYLDKRKIAFAIRLRNNTLLNNWCSVQALFAHLATGELKLLQQRYEICNCKLSLSGMKLKHNDYAIIATNRHPAQAFTTYKRRWEIERLFSALKKTGFNLEATHMTELTKLNTLFALLVLAFVWVHHLGEWLDESKTKILKRKAHLRREKSFFRHGLDYLKHLLSNINHSFPDFCFCLSLFFRGKNFVPY